MTDGYNIAGIVTMGIAERKAREKNQRRIAIMAAAKRLILKHGVEGMSMNQLADSIELNKATLYLYFRDKDDLIDAVVYEGLVLLEKEYRRRVAAPAPVSRGCCTSLTTASLSTGSSPSTSTP